MAFMKRIFDLFFSICFALVASVPILVVAIFVKMTSKGPVMHWSDRVGTDNEIFRMPKFRTMKIGTPAVATHLMKDPDAYLTPIGPFLRKSSLDELPQLWSVLKGEINGRDDLPIHVKVEFDEYYLKHRSLMFDIKIIFLTLFKVLHREGVTH